MKYQGGVTGNDGSMINLPRRHEFDIKITAVDSSVPPRHSWQRVQRTQDHKWEPMLQRGTAAVDPAFEYNGAKATVGEIRPAFRHPGTGEVLFFLRVSQAAGDGCVGGICETAPSAVSLVFFATEPAMQPDNWINVPGEKVYWPDDLYPGCVKFEYYGGYTYNAQIFRQKMNNVLSENISVPVSRNVCTETRIDVTSDLAAYMPKMGYRLFDGPVPIGGGCPQITKDSFWETVLIKAERVITACLHDTTACGFAISLSQAVEFTIKMKFTDIWYEYGPNGIPGGSGSSVTWVRWWYELDPTPTNPNPGDAMNAMSSDEKSYEYRYASSGKWGWNIDCVTTGEAQVNQGPETIGLIHDKSVIPVNLAADSSFAGLIFEDLKL